MRALLEALRQLNDLESGENPEWVSKLTPYQRTCTIEALRETVPTSLLGHHDRMLLRGLRSLVPVRSGRCGACGFRLPSLRRERRGRSQDLDVCSHCGAFLDWTGFGLQGPTVGSSAETPHNRIPR